MHDCPKFHKLMTISVLQTVHVLFLFGLDLFIRLLTLIGLLFAGIGLVILDLACLQLVLTVVVVYLDEVVRILLWNFSVFF